MANLGMQMLTEAGCDFDRGYMLSMNESKQLQVTDNVLVEMFKLISDKYNSIDFSEIEASKGDFTIFKYRHVLEDNVKTLSDIYMESDNPGSDKYVGVINNATAVMDMLSRKNKEFNTLWKRDMAIAQVLYTSCVSSIIYAISTLISNTIRFVTSEVDTSCDVLFDEVPNSIKHIHFRNLEMVANDIPVIEKTVDQLCDIKPQKMNEVAAEMMTGVVVVGAILAIPRLLYLVREIIYTVYCSRIRISEALEIEEALIRTNIESLESRPDKKGKAQRKRIIARQAKIADRLSKLSKRIAVKSDTVEVKTKAEIKKDTQKTRVAKDSGNTLDVVTAPQAQNYGDYGSSGVMI